MLDGVDGDVVAEDELPEPDGAEPLGEGAEAVAVSLPLNGQVVVYSVATPLEVTVTTVVP